jgi:hypothetical protein
MINSTKVTNWPSLDEPSTNNAADLPSAHQIPAGRLIFDQGDQESIDAHLKVEEAAAKRRDFAIKLNQLQRAVDVATERLAQADARAAWLVRRAAELRAQVPSLWSMDVADIAIGVQPLPAEVELIQAMTTIQACDNAIASFGPVCEQLVKNLNGAKVLLSNFQDQP